MQWSSVPVWPVISATSHNPLQISQHAQLLMLSFFWALLGTWGHGYCLSLYNGADYRQSTVLAVRARSSAHQCFISHCEGFVWEIIVVLDDERFLAVILLSVFIWGRMFMGIALWWHTETVKSRQRGWTHGGLSLVYPSCLRRARPALCYWSL